jgi:DNA invertase Pin-like site-specific DNA recombinase
MRTVQYIRVSTVGQNPDRQVQEGVKAYEDRVKGSVAFKDRENAQRLMRDIEAGKVEEVIVHSIDRLGRNTLDIMQTIQWMTSKGVNVISRKEGLQTLVEGKENPLAKMMVGILATLAEFELERIKERRQEGVAKAKERGAYKENGGRKRESLTAFFVKPEIKKCRRELEAGESLRRAANLAGVSLGTAQKVKRLMEVA